MSGLEKKIFYLTILILIILSTLGLVFYISRNIYNQQISTLTTPELTINASANVSTKIRVGLIPVIDVFPFIIAEQEKLFEKERLDIELIWFGSARDRDNAIITGRIDVAVHDPIGSLMLISNGVPIKIIGFVCCEESHESNIGFYLLGRPGINTKSLNISSVAVSRNTIIEYVAWRMLQGLGIDPRKANFVDIPSILNRYQLLIEGKIDYAVLPDPWGSLALTKNASLIAFHQDLVVLVAKEDLLKNNMSKNQILKLLRVLNEAIDLYIKNPDKYKEIIAEKLMIPAELRPFFTLKWNTHIKRLPENIFSDALNWLKEKNLVSQEISYQRAVEDLLK